MLAVKPVRQHRRVAIRASPSLIRVINLRVVHVMEVDLEAILQVGATLEDRLVETILAALEAAVRIPNRNLIELLAR